MQAGQSGLRSISFRRYSVHLIIAKTPLWHCGQVFQCVCPIKKPLGKGRGAIIQGLHPLSSLYIYSNGTGAKQSPRIGQVVVCITRTIYYHAPRAPFTAFHLNISSTDASGCDPSVLSQWLGEDVNLQLCWEFRVELC